MLDDLYLGDNLRAAQDLVYRPGVIKKPEPQFSMWGLSTAAPRGITAGTAQTGGFVSDVLGAFGQVLGAYPEAMGPVILTPEQRKQADEQRQQLLTKGIDYSSPAGDSFRDVARSYAPDPQTAHASERIVFDFARVATKAVGYSIATGGVGGGALLTGADEAFTTADDLKQQGVDLPTRAKVGAVAGASTALGVVMPVAGKTVAGTAGLVVLGGPVTFAAQQQAIKSILEAQDYGKLAEQYDPLDPVGLAVSTLLPAAFGAWSMRAARSRGVAHPTEPAPGRSSDDQIAAARTMLAMEALERQNVLRGLPRAEAMHETAIARAIDQLSTGRRVMVNDVIASPDLTAARSVVDQIEALRAEQPELIAAAENLAEPGAIREARRELAQMEQQRPDLSDASTRELAKQIQTQQGVSYKAALSEAKKQLQGQLEDFTARQARIEQAIETNATAQRATQRLGEIDKRIAELEQQAGPAGRLAQFERGLLDYLRAAADDQPRIPERNPPHAAEPAAAPVAAQPKGPDAGSARKEPPPAAARAGSGADAAQARLVDDGAATRLQQMALERPDMMVRLDGMDEARPLAEVLQAIEAEAKDMQLDGDLMRTAVECALLSGV